MLQLPLSLLLMAAADSVRNAAILVLRLVRQPPPVLRAVADQTVRATTSVPLNSSEGAGRRGRDLTHHRRIAYGLALEARTALELLVASESVDPNKAAQADALLDRVCAMIWRLLHARQ